ncbi:MAG: DUF4837 family protein [Rikenellaceae bacterium]
MRRYLSAIIIAAAALLASCDALLSAADTQVVSQGSPYELIVVCNQPEWEGELGDTLRAVFAEQIPYFAGKEPYFDVLRVTASGYNKLVVRHRNIFLNVISPEIASPSISVAYDVNAAPQIIMTLQGPSADVNAAFLGENRKSVMQVLESAERDRSIDFGRRFSLASLDKLVSERFGVEMKVPQGYTLRQESEDMLWISYEYPTASQGFLLYSYPADGISSLEAENLIAARNRFTKQIPGPTDGSYMTTFMGYEPDYRAFRLEGRLWCELRGLWDVKGDFMGGPFVSYSTIDTATNRIFTIDCYVYSPKLGKRNFMRPLEHLIYNIKFVE